MTTETPKPVEVTQADREAAADIFAAAGWKGVAHRLRQGVVFPSDEPEEIAVNVLARHRLSTRPEAQSLPTVSGDVQQLRSDVFEILRRHDVSEQCFAEVAMVTFAALSPTVSGEDGLAEALDAVLATSGARGTYHALRYSEAVERAEAILTALRAQPSNEADGWRERTYLAAAVVELSDNVIERDGLSNAAEIAVDVANRILTASPSVQEAVAEAIESVDLDAAHQGILADGERDDFYCRVARAIIPIVLEEAAGVAEEFERREDGAAYDKRQNGRDDNFNCARASAANHIAQAIRSLASDVKEEGR